MTNAEIFFEKLKSSNKNISTKSADQRQEVISIVDDIISNFQKLNKSDFRNELGYNSRHNILKNLYDEKHWLENFKDIEHIADNYFMTKLCLATVGVHFEPR